MPVGGGIDAFGGGLVAVLFLQKLAEKAESHRRLCGGAGLGDDIHGEVYPLQQLLHLCQLVVIQAVAHKVDVGRILLFQVIVGGAQALDNTPGP